MFSHLSRIQQDLFHELKKVSTDWQFNTSLSVRQTVFIKPCSLNPSLIHFSIFIVLLCIEVSRDSTVISNPAIEWDLSISVCGPGLFC